MLGHGVGELFGEESIAGSEVEERQDRPAKIFDVLGLLPFPPIPIYCGHQDEGEVILETFSVQCPGTTGEHWCGEYQRGDDAGIGD